LLLALVQSTVAAPLIPFFDDFNTGIQPGYVPWPGGSPAQNTLASDGSHGLGGTLSARAFATDPGAWTLNRPMSTDTTNGVADAVTTSVWVWDDVTAQSPVNAMLAFVGANGTTAPGFGTDYAELGLISGNSASPGNTNWVIRVRSDSPQPIWHDTGVARTPGWTLLTITADANPSAGGDGIYHFYINGNPVGPTNLTRNPAVGLQWSRIGSNSVSHQDFWYDNFSVSAVPEPSSVVLLCFGIVGLAGYGYRRRFAR
jgi:hypothetical protein